MMTTTTTRQCLLYRHLFQLRHHHHQQRHHYRRNKINRNSTGINMTITSIIIITSGGINTVISPKCTICLRIANGALPKRVLQNVTVYTCMYWQPGQLRIRIFIRTIIMNLFNSTQIHYYREACGIRLHMDQCNRVVDALFYLIDQRRMNPTLRDLALDGCMMPPPPPSSFSKKKKLFF